MNKENSIIKIIVLSDGDIHVALNNHKAVYGTREALIEVFRDPIYFYQEGFKKFKDSTKKVFPKKMSLSNLPALTLGYISEESSREIIFPVLGNILLGSYEESDKKIVNLNYLMSETVFENQMDFIIKIYLEVVGGSFVGVSFRNTVHLANDSFSPVLKEITDAYFNRLSRLNNEILVSEQFVDNEGKIVTREPASDNKMTPSFIPISEYSRLYGKNYQTIMSWIKRGQFKSAIQKGGHWYVDQNEVVKGQVRRPRKNINGNYRARLKSDAYEDVQKLIKARGLFTDAITPFIRRYEEAQYYEKREYHEVMFDGRPCLIIDIKPDYYCKQLGKTNRELIKSGEAPVVPDDNLEKPERFHVHHIGQKPSSPFAIIRASDHIGEFSKHFHSGSDGQKKHTSSFDVEKKAFWRTYLSTYDKYDGFKRIPYLNSKNTREARRH